MYFLGASIRLVSESDDVELVKELRYEMDIDRRKSSYGGYCQI